MGEIGAGSGTAYPGALDTGATAETASDYVRLNWGTDVEAAIVAIQAELGVDPAGADATVVARLDRILAGGATAAKPAAGDVTWGFFYDTTTETLEFSDGTTWHPVMLG